MNKEWHEARSKGIGGSDAGAICGINPWKTPLQVWEDKRGLAGPIDDNPAMYFGRALEPIIRQKYSEDTGREVLLPTGIIKSEKHDFMLANLDGITRDNRIVEIKTSARRNGWGDPGTDSIPLHYLFQCFHYMIVTGFKVTDVPVLIGGNDFRIYEVNSDPELEEIIIQRERDFWEMVLKGTPPAPVNYADVQRLYRRSEAKQITATEEIEKAVVFLNMVRSDMKMLEEREEETKKNIMDFMKEADELTDLTGRAIATWRSAKAVKRLDTKALRQQMPEIYNQFLTEGEPSRRFLLKGGGNKNE